jgi:hypothetical protein
VLPHQLAREVSVSQGDGFDDFAVIPVGLLDHPGAVGLRSRCEKTRLGVEMNMISTTGFPESLAI